MQLPASHESSEGLVRQSSASVCRLLFTRDCLGFKRSDQDKSPRVGVRKVGARVGVRKVGGWRWLAGSQKPAADTHLSTPDPGGVAKFASSGDLGFQDTGISESLGRGYVQIEAKVEPTPKPTPGSTQRPLDPTPKPAPRSTLRPLEPTPKPATLGARAETNAGVHPATPWSPR